MSATAQRKRSIFDESDDDDDDNTTSSPHVKKSKCEEEKKEEEPAGDVMTNAESVCTNQQQQQQQQHNSTKEKTSTGNKPTTISDTRKKKEKTSAGNKPAAISDTTKPRLTRAKCKPGKPGKSVSEQSSMKEKTSTGNKPAAISDTTKKKEKTSAGNKPAAISDTTKKKEKTSAGNKPAISDTTKPRLTRAKCKPGKSVSEGETKKYKKDLTDRDEKEQEKIKTKKTDKTEKKHEETKPIKNMKKTTDADNNTVKKHTGTTANSRPITEPPGTPEKTAKDEMAETSKTKVTLSPAQRARMEQKRQQALLLKREKMNRKNPYYMKTPEKKEEVKVVRINDTKLIDTGGGFFIEEVEGVSQDDLDAALQMVTEPVPLFDDERPRCVECTRKFNNSFLFRHFDHPVCDDCKDNEEKHSLIPKTDARNEYLLKDVDLEMREPTLKFIVRKNPHNSRWGDMKLYLKLQIEKRALEVWGTEEALEEALAKKEDQREINKHKKFNKKMKELRMNVRSSLYTRATKTHQHEYGEEEYLPDEDEYSRTCLTCGHSYTYDKL
ncbi:hypothetical protein Pmani_016961 [Petrolisthes manimaculis]|uniref:XPA C-terminal domain-containing protein n=1 Tax=Petrolisthes manimaculis TaxID=1843537 RepID=A0AAE1PQM0_9EUCA|nr:hypothetical protein Pmani_016961 [Petrolisthes manimaculis]